METCIFQTCGEIFMSGKGQLIIECRLNGNSCKQISENWKSYVLHLLKEHEFAKWNCNDSFEELDGAKIFLDKSRSDNDFIIEYEPETNSESEILEETDEICEVFSERETVYKENSNFKRKENSNLSQGLDNEALSETENDKDATSNDSTEKASAQLNKSTLETPLDCILCSLPFHDAIELTEHINWHLCNKYKCQLCKEGFRSKKELERHNLTHSGRHKSQQSLQCPICGITMSEANNMKAHVRRHSEKNRSKQCTVCPKRFFTNTELATHMRSHTKSKPYKCNECDAAFSTSSHLVLHLRRKLNKRQFKCDICNKGFNDNRNLKSHLITHSEERKFHCTDCSASFKQAKYLKYHRKIHENQKQYVCEVCSMGFNQKSGLIIHKKNKHNT